MRTVTIALIIFLTGCAAPDKLSYSDRAIARMQKPCVERGLAYASAEWNYCFEKQRYRERMRQLNSQYLLNQGRASAARARVYAP